MIAIKDNQGTPFYTASMAMLTMQATQNYYALAGYCTSTHTNVECGRIELTVHFDLPNYPKLPKGYMYSTREVSSHFYWSDALNKAMYVRTITFTFKF